MITWRYYLKIAAQGTLDGMVMRSMWADIGAGLLACLALVLRILILVTFPISTPLIAWLIMLDDRKHAVQAAEASARLRMGIHKNGPGYQPTGAAIADPKPPPRKP